jgi:hypothetical protein
VLRASRFKLQMFLAKAQRRYAISQSLLLELFWILNFEFVLDFELGISSLF